MQDILIEKIYKSLSIDRFQPYQLVADSNLKPALARYIWNLALSEALYPSLNMVEVLLRNSLNDFFTSLFDTPLWFNELYLRTHQQESLKKTILYLVEREKLILPSVSLKTTEEQLWFESLELHDVTKILASEADPGKWPGMIVAGMTFGFWIGFFHNEFEDFWRKNPKLQQVFPYFEKRPYGDLLRKPLQKRLQPIKELRNRVFHHEPIWNQRILKLNYHRSLDIIFWINPQQYAVLQAFDRFADIYDMGWEPYISKLEQLILTEVP